MPSTNNNLILRSLKQNDEDAFIEALNSWDSSSGFLFAQGFEVGMNFSDYIELLEANKKGQRLPQGYVPASIFCAFVGTEIVGRLAVRHELNDFLLKVGGHIGYGVVPKFRKMGYAKQMLSLAIPIAEALGIKQALVTCDDDNIASVKTIEGCGGILENKLDLGAGKALKRRYWIDTKIGSPST